MYRLPVGGAPRDESAQEHPACPSTPPNTNSIGLPEGQETSKAGARLARGPEARGSLSRASGNGPLRSKAGVAIRGDSAGVAGARQVPEGRAACAGIGPGVAV